MARINFYCINQVNSGRAVAAGSTICEVFLDVTLSTEKSVENINKKCVRIKSKLKFGGRGRRFKAYLKKNNYNFFFGNTSISDRVYPGLFYKQIYNSK